MPNSSMGGSRQMGTEYGDDGGTGTIKIGASNYHEEKPQNDNGGCCG